MLRRILLIYLWSMGLILISSYAYAAYGKASPLATTPSCQQTLAPYQIGESLSLRIRGIDPTVLTVHVPANRRVLIEADEQRIDLTMTVLSPEGATLARADNPVRRWGKRIAILDTLNNTALAVQLQGKEHAEASGTVRVTVTDLSALPAGSACIGPLAQLAMADQSYALGQDISLGHTNAAPDEAHARFSEAADGYQHAYEVLDSARDPDLKVAAVLSRASVTVQDLKAWSDGAQWATEARDVAKAVHDHYRAARAEALLAAAWMELPALPATASLAEADRTRLRLPRTRELLRSLARFHDQRGEGYDAALQINNLGLTFVQSDEFNTAEAAFRDASRRLQALHEPARRDLAEQNVAMCEWSRGELQAAETHYEALFSSLRSLPNPFFYLADLSNAAAVSLELGHLDQALRRGQEGLRLAERIQSRIRIAQNLMVLGRAYYAAGDRESSRDYLERARAADSPDRHIRIEVLRSLAALDRDEKQFEEAQHLDLEALTLATAPTARSRREADLAMDLVGLGQVDGAMALLDKALATRQTDPIGRVEALIVAARIAESQRSYDKALGGLTEARELVKGLEDVEDEFRINLELARIHTHLRHHALALDAVNRALTLSDLLRRQTANPELRAQRQNALRSAFELKIQLLLEGAPDAATSPPRTADIAAVHGALETAESSRAQTLADYAALDEDPKNPASVTWQRRRATLYAEIGALQSELEALLGRANRGDARVLQFRVRLAALRRELDVGNAIVSKRSGNDTYSAPQAERWVRWLSAHARDAAIVEYWIGPEKTYAWLITGRGISLYPLGSSQSISAAATEAHDALRGYATVSLAERLEKIATLSALVIAPLSADMDCCSRLIVIPDGALTYVPFGVLTGRDGDPMVKTKDIAIAPAAWWLFRGATRDGAVPSDRILIVADPVYAGSDARLMSPAVQWTTATNGPNDRPGPHQRLPWTGVEADQIARLFPPSEVDLLTGLTATRPRILARDFSDYRYIHLAAHGVVDARMPQLSAILLGAYDEKGRVPDTALRAADLAERRFRADVVTLSACDTALGKEIAGEGQMGLAYMTLARGAHAVIASLWAVADETSATLMTDLYRELQESGRSAPAALGNAMRNALRRSDQADPALWGGYQVMIDALPAASH